MSQIQLVPNTTALNVHEPNGGTFYISPGEALYDQRTGLIHILKSNDKSDTVLLQLFPIKTAQIERNRAIARVASALIGVFGIDPDIWFFRHHGENCIIGHL